MKKTLLLASMALLASCTSNGMNQDDRNNPRNDRNSDRNYNNSGCCNDSNNQNYSNPNNSNPNYNNNGSMDRMQDADMQVTARVRNMLQNDSNIGGKGRYINAETTNGIVTITGDVPTREDSQYIERKVRSVKGVRGVDNQITVNQ